MRTARHAVEFTVVQGSTRIFLGLARPDIDVDERDSEDDSEDGDNFWSVVSDGGGAVIGTPDGVGAHDGDFTEWEGQEGFGTGDVVGMLLDCDAGTLTVKNNGERLGVAFSGLIGELCWAASLYFKDNHVQIGAADATAAGS